MVPTKTNRDAFKDSDTRMPSGCPPPNLNARSGPTRLGDRKNGKPYHGKPYLPEPPSRPSRSGPGPGPDPADSEERARGARSSSRSCPAGARLRAPAPPPPARAWNLRGAHPCHRLLLSGAPGPVPRRRIRVTCPPGSRSPWRAAGLSGGPVIRVSVRVRVSVQVHRPFKFEARARLPAGASDGPAAQWAAGAGPGPKRRPAIRVT